METTNYIRNVYEKVKKQGSRLFLKRRIGFLRFWVSITFAQRCYFLATSMLLIQLLLNIESGLFEAIMFGFALVGIVSETWPKFMVLWNSLPGKAVILFVYAIIANFALASASGMVNSITGVSASALPYSHNFALILMVPSWFFVTTLMALVGGMLVIFVYLFFLLLLKPFGVQRLWHQPGYRFVLSTAVARFVWTLGVALQLGILAGQVGLLSEFSSDSANPLITIEETENKRENSESQLTEEQAEDVSELDNKLRKYMQTNYPVLIDVRLIKNEVLLPKVSALPQEDGSISSMPLEDMTPLLPLNILKSEMIVDLLDISIKNNRDS